ncbi:hypothetical protein OIU84_026414 [Salix udensis]|uniref:DNA2/NAM7 helicase helicase domain-containing protein n=1 Tax=Salix udensis TaxID=889485 RepID=A0AAD6KP15_9ROSI|nr:hypothetical protein OIU84_026414 [Salix udensis]
MLTTLTGAFSHKLDNTSFDLVITDEAALALEIACWIALLKNVVLSVFAHSGNREAMPPSLTCTFTKFPMDFLKLPAKKDEEDSTMNEGEAEVAVAQAK